MPQEIVFCLLAPYYNIQYVQIHVYFGKSLHIVDVIT